MPSPSRRLLPRQILLAEFCLSETSATRAAIRAGYSARSARNQAHRLLANDDTFDDESRGVWRRYGRGTQCGASICSTDRLERLFGAALEAGRLDAALGALKAECSVSGVEMRMAARRSSAPKLPIPR